MTGSDGRVPSSRGDSLCHRPPNSLSSNRRRAGDGARPSLTNHGAKGWTFCLPPALAAAIWTCLAHIRNKDGTNPILRPGDCAASLLFIFSSGVTCEPWRRGLRWTFCLPPALAAAILTCLAHIRNKDGTDPISRVCASREMVLLIVSCSVPSVVHDFPIQHCSQPLEMHYSNILIFLSTKCSPTSRNSGRRRTSFLRVRSCLVPRTWWSLKGAELLVSDKRHSYRHVEAHGDGPNRCFAKSDFSDGNICWLMPCRTQAAKADKASICTQLQRG